MKQLQEEFQTGMHRNFAALVEKIQDCLYMKPSHDCHFLRLPCYAFLEHWGSTGKKKSNSKELREVQDH